MRNMDPERRKQISNMLVSTRIKNWFYTAGIVNEARRLLFSQWIEHEFPPGIGLSSRNIEFIKLQHDHPDATYNELNELANGKTAQNHLNTSANRIFWYLKKHSI